jgi:two-component system NtrC family sensor kinase
MIDLNQVVRETLALRAYEQRVTNVAVIDALASGLPQIFADPHQIQQVLLNLIINAEQADADRQRARDARRPHVARRDARSRAPRAQR